MERGKIFTTAPAYYITHPQVEHPNRNRLMCAGVAHGMAYFRFPTFTDQKSSYFAQNNVESSAFLSLFRSRIKTTFLYTKQNIGTYCSATYSSRPAKSTYTQGTLLPSLTTTVGNNGDRCRNAFAFSMHGKVQTFRLKMYLQLFRVPETGERERKVRQLFFRSSGRRGSLGSFLASDRHQGQSEMQHFLLGSFCTNSQSVG